MKTYNSGHGPIAVLSAEELASLEQARDVLQRARKIESDDGKLHFRNYPEIMSAEVALEVAINYQIQLDRKVRENAK